MSRLWLLCVLLMSALANAQSPYAGEQEREIKSLSGKEIVALRSGAGMGLAKAAELNGYPGPKHVLELADELGLSDEQRENTKALFAEVKANAAQLGEKVIAAEVRLDRLFTDMTVDAESLENALQELGELRARLRYVHLHAHVRQAAILRPGQIEAYTQLRGYE
ncbi:MAG: hypothetical protein QNJ00_06685 [Woeseiaceae bacterium]|nr:hypothetical protein [Woeseiaceae bacterium]